jgi:HlyD family secretion protein
VHPGEPANVTVDAYPDRRFGGVVEKIEPQAVVSQNVTMFPVLVNLTNNEGLLKPGMNGEVSVLIDERDDVLAIPNDAIKNPREAVATGAMLGLSADTVNAELRAQGFTGGGSRGGFGGGNGGRRGGNGGGGGGANRGGNGGGGGGTADGEVMIAQQGQGGQGGFGGGPQVSDEDCKKVDDVLKAHPKEKKQLDDLRAKLQALRPAGFGGANGGGGNNGGGFNPGGNRRPRGDSAQGGGANGGQRRRGGADSTGGGRGGNGAGGGFRGSPEMQAINEQIRAIYTALSLDARTAGACARRQGGNANAAGTRAASGGNAGNRAANGQGNLTPSPEMNGRPQRQRTGLVFVSDSSKTVFHPRIVQLGQANLDYTEVISGLKEGERVVMLGALALQAQRLQQQDRARANANPLGAQGPGGPGGPGAGGPRGGGGGGGGGGRGG